MNGPEPLKTETKIASTHPADSSRSDDFGDRAKLLLDINNAVVSNLDLPELIDSISVCLKDVVDHDSAVLYLYDSNLNQLRAHALKTERVTQIFERGLFLPLQGSPSGQAFTSRKTIITNLEDLPRYTSLIAACEG